MDPGAIACIASVVDERAIAQAAHQFFKRLMEARYLMFSQTSLFPSAHLSLSGQAQPTGTGASQPVDGLPQTQQQNQLADANQAFLEQMKNEGQDLFTIAFRKDSTIASLLPKLFMAKKAASAPSLSPDTPHTPDISTMQHPMRIDLLQTPSTKRKVDRIERDGARIQELPGGRIRHLRHKRFLESKQVKVTECIEQLLNDHNRFTVDEVIQQCRLDRSDQVHTLIFRARKARESRNIGTFEPINPKERTRVYQGKTIDS